MKLSVVIVNYNVRYFLEQCLHSVFKSGQGIDMEVFVVDNNSVDGSVSMIRKKFPQVNLIENHENYGFSKANNQAIQVAQGEYVLLLNPDTVVEETTFSQVIDFMDSHKDAGGLGVKMVDGKGRFLPESKRGLPTPGVAFKKISGLSYLFPHTKAFGQYHLGYLDKDEIHKVEILSGAFMFLRKSVLDNIGLLDEDFFMYGEDIDLSYRIIKSGFVNYYFPKTRIIHYKGESTKKSSINYVFVFYRAMIIFAKKHFSKKNAGLFSFLINLAIYFRAGLAIFTRFVKRIFLPVADISLIFGGMFFITKIWEQAVVYKNGGSYPVEFIIIAVPVYIFVWLFSVWLSGGYDVPVKKIRILTGLLIGTGVILLGYSLLGENMRFSRALIILGALWAIQVMLGIRYILNAVSFSSFRFESDKNKRFIIVGDAEETLRIKNLLEKTTIRPDFIGLVATSEVSNEEAGFIGNINQLKDIIQIYKIDEAIFCSKSMSPERIIDLMTELQYTNIDYKIAPQESLSIIGSNSINTSGDLYTLQVNAISNKSNKRFKRLLDLIFSLVLLSIWPLMIFFVKKPFQFLINIGSILFGKNSWVGYAAAGTQNHKLPAIKPAVLNPLIISKTQQPTTEFVDNLNMLYAKNYSVSTDLGILIKGLSKLGNIPGKR